MSVTRIRLLKKGKDRSGPIIYWMSRDQRANDNWALLYAQELSLQKEVPLAVVFCLVPEFLGATIRQYGFMLKGLKELERNLREHDITFHLITGQPEKELIKFIKKYRIGTLITDFDPLKIKKKWKIGVASAIDIPFYEVDTHNIIPCWVASSKQEFGAYTLRPKMKRLLPLFLEKFPKLKLHHVSWKNPPSEIDWDAVSRRLRVDTTVAEVDWIIPGEKAAKKVLNHFIQNKLTHYGDVRNDPNKDGQSHLSPYVHFGQIAPQRVALEVKKSNAPEKTKEAFLEELIVRRELSDNFCFYNSHYDEVDAFPQWAQKTLCMHRRDKRTYLYDQEELERGETHDPLWNAAQMEMVKKGKMHGYMRMYWGKKILEWTRSPEEALKIAIYLNDKYELDGRDPNGYTGTAWCIGGVHDRAWGDRSIFGKIRYMSYNGCKSKFNVTEYIKNNADR
jgi:deoxyribodipyrimidine photo-lyase